MGVVVLCTVVAVKDKMMCLLCNSMITTVKKYNANQHYATHWNHKHVALESEAHKEVLKKMKFQNQQLRQVFQSVSGQGTNITEETHRIAYILRKKGKSYSDAKLVKDCIIEAVLCFDSDKVCKYNKLLLSTRTTTDPRCIWATLHIMPKRRCVLFDCFGRVDWYKWFGTSAIFHSSCNFVFSLLLCEELLGLGTLTERTRRIDLLNLFKEKLCKVNPNLANLVSVCTHDAPSMIGKHERFVALLRRELSNTDTLMPFHCILHQQTCVLNLLCWVIPWMEWQVSWIRSERMQ